MSQQPQVVVQTQQKAAVTSSIKGGILQRKCACGQHTIAGGECEECSKKQGGMIQRAAVITAPTNSVPPIVHDVLSSPGQPLDAGMRAFMEPRFGHDFSGVRVHTDARAAESARAVNALAYTMGWDVVFGTGQYAPGASEGRRLMAHELTLVVQQESSKSTSGSIGSLNDPYESEADSIAVNVLAQQLINSKLTMSTPFLQRQDRSRHAPSASPQSPKLQPHAVLKTACDVKPLSGDLVAPSSKFRTVGKGVPQIVELDSSVKTKFSCLFEVAMAHEKQHVQNSSKPCSDFKKCVDTKSSKISGKISYEDFEECYDQHHNGLPADCIKDEQSAYEASIKKAKELVNEQRCLGEKNLLQENIKFEESIKDNAPNCKAASSK